ncbi:hypothetical protein [Acidiluteibacter ferrifornacis]|uniref:Uncharacterized protein n=1 Tax=Acidiluteibacter ferrifornacis TaxID=2692424 RepID=A0A6N9NKL7_9FLAO|nr:hypothetical protein [Acidiluteibacter ferrifornacis]NBG65707.1 hypothetical protein [Acidiluteibacter ferrifornacis]
MNKLIITLIYSSLCFNIIADEAPYKMHELLLKTNLVAHVQLSASEDDFFRLEVLSVLHRKQSGITEGDYLKVKHDFNVVCPPSFPKQFVIEKKKALAFLTYHKGQWHLTQGEIVFLKNDTAEFDFYEEGYVYSAPISEWKKSITEYHQHFTLNQEGKVMPKLKSTDYQSNKHTALTQLQYISLNLMKRNSLVNYPNLQEIDLVSEVEFVEKQIPDQNRIYLFAAKPSITDSIQLLIQQDLLAQLEKILPGFREKGIYGSNFYSLVIEKDGRISKVEINRVIDNAIGEEIERYFINHNQWKAALNEKGEKIRYKQRMVLKIEPKK